MVGSELAAMFDCIVIPTLRKHYEPEKRHRFKRRCKEFARRLGLPAEEWPRVTFPAPLSFDNDKRHPHVRKTMLTPRHTHPELEEMREDAIRNGLHLESASKRRRDEGCASQADRIRGVGSGVRQQVLINEALACYKSQHKVDFWEQHKWDLAREQPEGMVCLLPEQYMPLCENTGDLHCPAEHMVGTVKRDVREHLLRMDLNDPALWKGRTYQQLIEQAVERRGNGAAGQKHIGRSVEKWRHVAAILAADKSETLQLRYTFGDGGANPHGGKREVHAVKGTAGEWIRDTRWT